MLAYGAWLSWYHWQSGQIFRVIALSRGVHDVLIGQQQQQQQQQLALRCDAHMPAERCVRASVSQ